MNIQIPTTGIFTPQKPIPLGTRLGHPIANGVGVEPNDEGKRQYRMERAYHPNWVNRRPANGEYNCWGMVFASRRTGIYDDSAVEQILQEDGYRKVKDYSTDIRQVID